MTQSIDTIRLYRGSKCWAALFGDHRRALGWLPLPFTNEAPSAEVVETMQQANPACRIEVTEEVAA